MGVGDSGLWQGNVTSDYMMSDSMKDTMSDQV